MPRSEKSLVRFACPECGKQLRAAAEHAGRRSKCPRCQTIVVIPEAEYRLTDEAAGPRLPQPPLKVICPVCRTVMMARPDQVGQTVQCPDCGTRSTVVAPVAHAAPPQPKPADDLYALADDGLPPSQKTYIPVHCGRCGTLMHAEPKQIGRPMKCPDCGTKTVVPAPVSVPVERSPRTPENIGTYDILDGQDQPDLDSPAYEAHFPVHCPRCSTRLLATRQQLGTRLACPDCGTSVPVPPLEQIQERMADDRADVLPPVLGYAVKVSPEGLPLAARQSHSAVAGMHEPTLRHGERPKMVEHPFWQGNLTPLLQSPGWAIWIGLTAVLTLAIGLVLGAVLLGHGGEEGGVASAGNWFTALLMTALCLLILAIWGGAASFVGLAILRDTAAGNERIENWPSSYWIDELSQILFVLNALTLTGGAVYGLHRLLMLAGIASPWIDLVIALAFFPFLLLSMLETDSAFWPFSLPTIRSLYLATGGWLQFHAASLAMLVPMAAVAVGLDWLLGVWAVLPFAAIVSAAWLIYFRLLGRLAWYCGEHSVLIEEAEEEATT